MTLRLRNGGIGLAASLLVIVSAGSAYGVAYQATLLTSPSANGANAYGVSGTSIVGGSYPEAILWNGATNTFVSLNPGPDWTAFAYAVDGNHQVGSGEITGSNEHALLWNGTAASYVDLHPDGFASSLAIGVSGNTQVGSGLPNTNPPSNLSHALVWHGTAASAVDINPPGYAVSSAEDVYGDDIVGSVSQLGNSDFHAQLWTGPAHTLVNLQPAGFVTSLASGVWQNSQVGTAYTHSDIGDIPHAVLWHGTAASVVDLSPAGFFLSAAIGVAGNLQVGYGSGTPTGGNDHALLWQGTAASVVDLHSSLAGLGPDFVTSFAQGVDASGRIVGWATDINNAQYAVEWSPVPEPSTAALSLFGLAMIGGRRWRNRCC